MFDGTIGRSFGDVTAPAARARPKHRWIIPEPPDPTAVARLMQDLHLPEPLCRLLAGRGLADIDAAKVYLRPRLDQLHETGLSLPCSTGLLESDQQRVIDAVLAAQP